MFGFTSQDGRHRGDTLKQPSYTWHEEVAPHSIVVVVQFWSGRTVGCRYAIKLLRANRRRQFNSTDSMKKQTSLLLVEERADFRLLCLPAGSVRK